MNKLLFISIFCIASFTVNGQRATFGASDPDTLNASETIYQYIGDTSTVWASALEIEYPAELVILVQSDSLSGATAATITVEYCLDNDCTLTYTAGTLTANGAASQQLRVEDLNFVEQKIRVKGVATSGTQETKFQTAWAIKRRQ